MNDLGNLMLQGLTANSGASNTGAFETVVSIDFLLQLHNSLERGHPSRQAIVDHIKKIGATNAKAHWTGAIVQTESGDLIVDDGLYNVAVYRGKQETRIATAEKAFAELQAQLELLHTFHEKEQSAAAALAPKGASLVEIREFGPSLQHVKEHAKSLARIADRMKSGLANNVAGTVEPGEHGQR